MTPRQLDDLDRGIISQLQQDGRRPFRAIARALGVAEGTVRYRAGRLQEEGMLRILALAIRSPSATRSRPQCSCA